ncbi:hypothetical protein [Sporosarcina sp. 6E9]|uniref:hypothetical protein n=1 Tax=Sporosarcina sp. 6E9 TaxID=2819235 RepID=UPI001FF0AF98|nr:hypothetical protein [Sporosarcina sp. 6E9]
MNNKNSFFIPAGIFIGLGIGLAIKQPAVGLFIGLGCGLLMSALSTSFQKNKNE